jgi:hypothetical protein
MARVFWHCIVQLQFHQSMVFIYMTSKHAGLARFMRRIHSIVRTIVTFYSYTMFSPINCLVNVMIELSSVRVLDRSIIQHFAVSYLYPLYRDGKPITGSKSIWYILWSYVKHVCIYSVCIFTGYNSPQGPCTYLQ